MAWLGKQEPQRWANNARFKTQFQHAAAIRSVDSLPVNNAWQIIRLAYGAVSYLFATPYKWFNTQFRLVAAPQNSSGPQRRAAVSYCVL